MSARQSSHPLQELQPRTSPVRRCVVCRATAPRSELLRIVRRANGEIEISARGEGRGAYVHPQTLCLTNAATQPKHLGRALRRPPPERILTQLNQIAAARPNCPSPPDIQPDHPEHT